MLQKIMLLYKAAGRRQALMGEKEEEEEEEKRNTGEGEEGGEDKTKSKVGTRWVRQQLFFQTKFQLFFVDQTNIVISKQISLLSGHWKIKIPHYLFFTNFDSVETEYFGCQGGC